MQGELPAKKKKRKKLQYNTLTRRVSRKPDVSTFYSTPVNHYCQSHSISTYSFLQPYLPYIKKNSSSEDVQFALFFQENLFFSVLISNNSGQTRFLPNSRDFSYISGTAERPRHCACCNKCLLNVFIIIQATIDMVQNSNMVHLFAGYYLNPCTGHLIAS